MVSRTPSPWYGPTIRRLGVPVTQASGAVVALANANDPGVQERFPCGFLGGRSMPARRRQRARPRALHADRGRSALHDGQDCGCLERSVVGPWMDDLTQQSARLAPDLDVFSRRAMDIVALLRASIDPLRD